MDDFTYIPSSFIKHTAPEVVSGDTDPVCDRKVFISALTEADPRRFIAEYFNISSDKALSLLKLSLVQFEEDAWEASQLHEDPTEWFRKAFGVSKKTAALRLAQYKELYGKEPCASSPSRQDNRCPMIDLVATGQNISALRTSRGLSVSDMQAFFGFDAPQAIYKWQKGLALPSTENLYALAVLLKVPIEKILIPKDLAFAPDFKSDDVVNEEAPVLKEEAKNPPTTLTLADKLSSIRAEKENLRNRIKELEEKEHALITVLKMYGEDVL